MSQIELDKTNVKFIRVQCDCLKKNPAQVYLHASLDPAIFTGYCPHCQKLHHQRIDK